MPIIYEYELIAIRITAIIREYILQNRIAIILKIIAIRIIATFDGNRC